jgi:hypothetical protein
LVRNATTQRPRDPEFDRSNSTVPMPTEDVIRYYQRLIVNPFLALFAGLLTFLFCEVLARLTIPVLIVPALGLGMVGACFLLQYHCLDCGTTGPFHSWKQHSCSSIWERWQSGRISWNLPYPAASTQLVLWVLACIGFGYLSFVSGL